jgi:hypothetical protein
MHVLVLPSSTKSQLHEPLGTTTTTTSKVILLLLLKKAEKRKRSCLQGKCVANLLLGAVSDDCDD